MRRLSLRGASAPTPPAVVGHAAHTLAIDAHAARIVPSAEVRPKKLQSAYKPEARRASKSVHATQARGLVWFKCARRASTGATMTK